MSRLLNALDFANLLGEAQEPRLVENIFEKYSNVDWSYRNLNHEEFDKLVLEIVASIEAGNFDKSCEERRTRWVDGWGENLAMLLAGEPPEVALKPKYYRKNRIVRFGNNLVKSKADNLEWVFFQIIRDYIFEKYLKRFDEIHEFGCGSVHNLYDWAMKRPDLVLKGYDWADSAVEIGRVLRDQETVNLDVANFDIFRPQIVEPRSKNAAMVTIGALEQVGDQYDEFLKFMRGSSFKRFVHLEPFLELYDQSHTLDFLARKYSVSRNYLNGYLSVVKSLSEEGSVHLDVVKKVELGGRFHLGWNICVWSNRHD